MGWRSAAGSAALGYLLGSLSFARLIARGVNPAVRMDRMDVQLSSGEVFTSDSVSATLARVKLGTRFGVLTGLLDMLKVALPTLLVRRRAPQRPLHLVVAGAGLIGHDFPLYHGFKGGRGESPIYGVMLALDPVGVAATTAAGAVIGFLAGNILVLRWAGLVLLVPWAALVRRDGPLAVYTLFGNAVYWWTMWPELSQYGAMRGSGTDPSQEEIAAEFGMGAGLGRALDRYSMPAIWQRIRRRG